MIKISLEMFGFLLQIDVIDSFLSLVTPNPISMPTETFSNSFDSFRSGCLSCISNFFWSSTQYFVKFHQ